MRQAAALVGSLFEEKKDVELCVSLQPSLPIILIDEDRIIQVLVNLLSNAYKFTSKGEVKIEAKREGEDLLFIVSDTGKGIAPEDIDMVFQKFYQRKMKATESGVAPGTGLGLAICKEIVEHYKGTISVTSSIGKGSTFTARINVASQVGVSEISVAK